MDTIDRSGMVQIVGNQSDFVEIRSTIGWTGQKTNSVQWAVCWGWTGNILGNIRSARLRLESGSARCGGQLGWTWLETRLELGLNGSARLNMARVDGTHRLPLTRVVARGLQSPDLQAARVSHRGFRSGCSLHQWGRMEELYTVEGSKLVFDNFENSGISQNTSVFWRTGLWYQLLVGETTCDGFETHRGDKTHSFISKTSLQITKTYNLNTHPLFSLLCFSLLFPTRYNTSLKTYLYRN